MQGILLQRRNDIECINDINMDLITVIFTTFDYVTRHPFKGKILCRLFPVDVHGTVCYIIFTG